MKRTTSLTILFLIIILGFIFRYINITKYNIYSDSYEFLLGAKNLVEQKSLDGFLGKEGMYWGPLFYNRVGFSYFLVPFYIVIKNLETSAYVLSFMAGILSIPLIYLLAVRIFKKREIGLIAALLLTTSFSNIMLSGFVMANTLVVLFIILTVLCFFNAQKKNNSKWFIFAGFLFGLTCFLRAEILITLPAFLASIFLTQQRSLYKSLFFFLSFFLTLTFLFLTFYLLLSNFSLWWLKQNSYLKNFKEIALLVFLLAILSGIILIYFLKKKEDWFLKRQLGFFVLIVLGTLSLALILPLILNRPYSWSSSWFTLQTDFLIILFGLGGLVLLLKNNFIKGVFAYLFIFPLLFVYFAFGGGGDFRHLNLISPLLVLLAAFLFDEILLILKNWLHKKSGLDYKISLTVILLTIGILFYCQLYQDLKPWHAPISYEKEVGLALERIIKEKSIPQQTILISSFPEAHYVYTGLSTQEPRDKKPYLSYNIIDSKKILLVIDEGIRDRYPNLAAFADKKLKPYALKSFFSTVKYQYGQKTWYPYYPVTVYYLKAEKFRQIINN